MNNQYTTLSEGINQLKERGYTCNFEINNEGQLCEVDGKKYSPSEIELHEYHRFEGMSNPADSSILYALQTASGLKGLLVDAYGVDVSRLVSNFMNQVEETKG